MTTCLYCSKTINNNLGLWSHQSSCKYNTERVKRVHSPNAHAKKGCIPWNKGRKSLLIPWNKGRTALKGTPHTEETKRRLSEVAKEHKFGGYVKGSGRGKKGWYKGFFCDSSWELAYVVYCLEHGIDIKRNTEKRKYLWHGVVKYGKDFIRLYE